MSTDNTEKNTELLDELEKLLSDQVDSAKRGDLESVADLSGQVRPVADEISDRGTLEPTEFKERAERLGKLYRELLLVVSSEKDKAGRQLQQVREGRKAIGAYRGNL